MPYSRQRPRIAPTGRIAIRLSPDDPLYVPGSPTNFMALTRATVTLDANGVPQHENTTTSFVDQNQTYTSHASHRPAPVRPN